MNNYEKNEIQKYSYMKNQSHLFSEANIYSDIILDRVRYKMKYSSKITQMELSCDIDLNGIFIQSMNSYKLFNTMNNIYIKLSEEEIIERRSIIESLKRFINNNSIKFDIIYNIIYLFDILVSLNNKDNISLNYEQIGLGSAILMIKYINAEKRNISLKKFQSFYESKYYSTYKLKVIEILCLKLIDYYLNFPTPLFFVKLYIIKGYIFSTDNLNTIDYDKMHNSALKKLESILFLSNEYIKYNPLYLSSYIICFVREKYKLEKWPNMLYKFFNVDQNNFETIYEEYLLLEKNRNNKNEIIESQIINQNLNLNFLTLKNVLKENKKDNINIHRINKEIRVNKNYNQEEKVSSQKSIFNIINNSMNIKLNYRTCEEMRNSSLFRKMKKNYGDFNISDSSNNITPTNEVKAILKNKKSNKISINCYKIAEKDNNENKSPIFYKPIKKGVEYNNIYHHRNISNITISTKNNNILDYEKEHLMVYNRERLENCESERNIEIKNYNIKGNINQKKERYIYKKINNKTNDNINFNLDEKREIKVRTKDFNYKKNIEKKKINKNNIVQLESIEIGGKNNNINTNEINNNIYRKNIITKIKENSILNKNNNLYNNDIKKNSEEKILKHIYINRLSSCNNKLKSKIINGHNKDYDYSNETTSENSNNISFRRNYLRLKQLKDNSKNIICENTTITQNNNLEINKNNEKNKEHFSLIKCHLTDRGSMDNYNNNKNKNKISQFKDCLKIGFGSFTQRYNKIYKENKIVNDNSKSVNRTKRVDIRNYYKFKKNINKNI